MQIRCAGCGRTVTVAATGELPARCPHCQAPPAPERLGKWRIDRLLAAGGMGEVYLAHHEQLGSPVAIKLLPPQPAGDAAALRERFLREAKLTAKVAHPGVVHVLDFASEGDRLFLVLEYVDGRSLRSVLRDGPLAVAEALRIAAAVADVLAAAHARGVVHRDIKPENVIVAAGGTVRVLDFGIAKALQDQEPITRTGEILGTPEYMAPEQLLEGPDAVLPHTDVHALGVLLYEMLTGRSPFAGSNLFQALKLVESLLPPPPSSLRESVPPPIDALVLRALAKEPGERPASAAEFATALAAAVVNAAPQPAGPAAVIGRLRQLWPVHLLLASLLLLGAVLLLLQGSLPPLPAPTLALDAEARATAARTIHDTLRQTHLRPDQLELLRAAIRQLDDASSAREQFARGRAELRLGACAAALSDLDAALRGGVAEARDLAAVAWLGMHVLLPATVAAPAWLLPGDCRRRDRIFATGTGTDGPAVNGSRLWTAASQLAAGDARAAWNTVHAEQGRAVDLEPMAEALVALLSARQLCAEDAAFARIAAGLSANLPDWPLLELLGRQSTAARARSFADAIAQLAPETPDRWLLELLRTFDAALRGSTPDALLSAPAELAWLTGAGPAALVWHAALQLQLAQRSPAHAVEAATAGSLLSLLQGQDAGDWPAVVPARALLSLADSGIAAAEAVLAVLPATPAPPLAMFACWRDAVGKGGAPLQLARGTAWFLLARSDQARSCLDRCEQAEPEVRAGAHFLRALLQDTPVPLAPAEVAAVPAAVLAVAAAPAWPARADALAGLVEHLLGAGAEPRSLLPLLRAAAIAGADVAALLAGSLRVFEDGGLHAAYLQEVCGGIH